MKKHTLPSTLDPIFIRLFKSEISPEAKAKSAKAESGHETLCTTDPSFLAFSPTSLPLKAGVRAKKQTRIDKLISAC